MRTLPTRVAIARFQAVSQDAVGAIPADPTEVKTRAELLGVATRAAKSGQDALVATDGDVISNPSWAFTGVAPCYVGASGIVTQTPPGTGWVRVIGISLNTTSLMVAIDAFAAMPYGGTTGQVLTKLSNDSFDVEWAAGGGGGGSGSLDGGTPSSIYGGTTPIDGGPP